VTDGQTELRWLRRAESIAAFARKNRASDGKFSAAATDVVDLVSLLSRIFYSFTRRISVVTLVEVKKYLPLFVNSQPLRVKGLF